MNSVVFGRFHETECVQTAKIKRLPSGRCAFETSLFGEPYEINMNMPLFDNETDAALWISTQEKWKDATGMSRKDGQS